MSMDKPQIENLELLVKTTTALQRTRKETTERQRKRHREREREISPVPPAPALAPPLLYYCPFSSLSLCKRKVLVLVLVLFLVVLLLFTLQTISHPQNSRKIQSDTKATPFLSLSLSLSLCCVCSSASCPPYNSAPLCAILSLQNGSFQRTVFKSRF